MSKCRKCKERDSYLNKCKKYDRKCYVAIELCENDTNKEDNKETIELKEKLKKEIKDKKKGPQKHSVLIKCNGEIFPSVVSFCRHIEKISNGDLKLHDCRRMYYMFKDELINNQTFALPEYRLSEKRNLQSRKWNKYIKSLEILN